MAQWLRARLSGVFICMGVLGQPASVPAQDAEAAFFRDKTVHFIIGFGAGGGYDAYARLIAPYLAKELGANVIVENQPGAGGNLALNNLVAAPPDGLRLMLVNGWSSGLSQINNAPGVRFDLDKMTQLGTVSASPSLWLVSKNSPLRTTADAHNVTKPLIWSGLGPDDGMFVGARVTCEALKIPCEVVLGYKGTNEAGLAVARGETESVYLSETSANEYVRMGDVRAMATVARQRSRFFPDLPTIFEAEKLSPEAEWLLDFQGTFEALGRILVLPPDMPLARLAFMRAAVERTLRNSTLVAEGERTQRYIDFIDAETTRQSVRKAIGSLTEAQKTFVRGVLSPTK